MPGPASVGRCARSPRRARLLGALARSARALGPSRQLQASCAIVFSSCGLALQATAGARARSARAPAFAPATGPELHRASWKKRARRLGCCGARLVPLLLNLLLPALPPRLLRRQSYSFTITITCDH